MCVCVAPLVRQSACLPVDAGLEFPAPCFFFFFFFSFLFLKWTLHALFYPSRLLSIRFSIEYRIIRNACRYWLWEYQISGRLVIQIQRPLANGWWVRGGDMGFHRKFLLMKPKRRWRYENIIVPLSLLLWQTTFDLTSACCPLLLFTHLTNATNISLHSHHFFKCFILLLTPNKRKLWSWQTHRREGKCFSQKDAP